MEKPLARRSGFTLIELIIVIAIIAIIVAAVFVAMDPVKRLNASRNARRSQDVGALAQALSIANTDLSLTNNPGLEANTVLTAGGGVATLLGCTGTDGCVGDWFMIGTGENPSLDDNRDGTDEENGTSVAHFLSNAGVGNACETFTACGSTLPAEQVTTRDGCISLDQLVDLNYIPRIPVNPFQGTDDTVTGYAVSYNNGAFIVRACLSEAEGAGGTGDSNLIEASR